MVEYGCNVANKFGFPMSDDEEFDDPQELITRVAQLEAEKAAAQKKADKLAKQAAAAPPPKEPVKSAGNRGRGGNANTFSDAPKDVQDNHLEEVTHESAPVEFQGMVFAVGFAENVVVAVAEATSTANEEDVEDHSVVDVNSIVKADQTVRVCVGLTKRTAMVGATGEMTRHDELVGETEPIAVPEEPEVPREKTAEELAQEALEAEYAKQKTLKEYFEAQKVQKEAPKFNVRKAGEGEEENFGKLVKLQKEVMVDKEEEEVSIIRREPREKALHIDIQFAEPNRGFRGDRPP
ncbi:unnamed protein product, partial [Nippostrongylus brasiliensis]|uniref:HABP4_PAI-RBP1 domain-containing protein n=1 Tax=Nippostrongylus brasiliensis TaxID=27835 RepID=A0A0N4YR10_NIPBR